MFNLLKILMVAVFTALFYSFAAQQDKQKPNIVLIFSDDVGWTGLSCFGCKYYETPNIDKLASDGMKFTHGYAAATVCAPSRVALMSGQYSSRNGTLRVSDVPKPYAAMTESLDFTVGRIFHTLDSLGLWDNTLIVFTSDNGASARTNPDGTIKKNCFTSNVPLRDGKGLMYEGGIRVPYIFYWKGKIKPGTVNENPVTGIDLYPTFLDVAGIPKPEGQVPDGTSIAKCLFDPDYKMPVRPLFWHYPNYGPTSVKNGKVHYAYIPTDVLILGDYKLLEFYHDKIDHVELYNLKDDIGELHDPSKEMPEKVKEMQAILHRLQKESNASMPVPNPAYDPNHKDTSTKATKNKKKK